MPDDYYGEKACAFVILKPGERLTLSDLVAFVESTRIARFKFPERLEVVEFFPMSPVGKILRHELRKTIAARLAEENAKPVGQRSRLDAR